MLTGAHRHRDGFPATSWGGSGNPSDPPSFPEDEMPTEKQIRAAADRLARQINEHTDERIQPVEKGEVQRAHDGTAWVACWLRVSRVEALAEAK